MNIYIMKFIRGRKVSIFLDIFDLINRINLYILNPKFDSFLVPSNDYKCQIVNFSYWKYTPQMNINDKMKNVKFNEVYINSP